MNLCVFHYERVEMRHGDGARDGKQRERESESESVCVCVCAPVS